MDHEIVMQQCREVITDDVILQMIYQYLTRLEIFDGEYRLVTKGIPKGCSLSPIIGAIMLKALDKALGNKYFYIRYMDDWIVFTKTRWELREAVKITHSVIKELKFKLAVDKTYIGRIDKGFDFLGYRFNRQGIVGLADKTVGNFLEHRAKLYEQGAPDQRIREYVRRWVSWVNAGLA